MELYEVYTRATFRSSGFSFLNVFASCAPFFAILMRYAKSAGSSLFRPRRAQQDESTDRDTVLLGGLMDEAFVVGSQHDESDLGDLRAVLDVLSQHAHHRIGTGDLAYAAMTGTEKRGAEIVGFRKCSTP